MIWPVFGSTTLPTQFTATSAATTTPFPIRRLAVPMPPFIGSPGCSFPMVAPVPAPTLPSATGTAVCREARLVAGLRVRTNP